ncbi:hypothetical protein C8R46DRAFT_946771 [Mycena filopes]|nr:hypothetical protein C8R46DRAFT_946771 [Mycena filopes]
MSLTSSFALGPLSNRPPVYQNQYLLLNEGDTFRLAVMSRRILALPPEILAEIFVHCVEEWSDRGGQETPHSISRVCRQFRAVALSTSRLWSSICVDLELKDQQGAYVDICRIWLSRAGILPISLTLIDVWNKRPDPKDSLITGLSERLRALEIGGSFWAPLLSGDSGSMTRRTPLLEELIISTPIDPVVLHDAPKLRIISVCTWTPQMQVPYHQLTTFRAAYIDTASFLAILQNFTNLLHAAFSFHDWLDQSTSLPLPEYRHACLQRLHLSGHKPDSDDVEEEAPFSLLRRLKIPALKGLSIKLQRLVVLLTLSPLLSFLSQPGLRLQKLRLSSITTPVKYFIQCLELTPSLTHLALDCVGPFSLDALFVQLTGHQEFLPRLESFDLEPSFDYWHKLKLAVDWSLTPTVVIEMLCWRWTAAGITQLQSFRLQDPISSALKSHPDFRRLEGEGMLLSAGDVISADAFWDFAHVSSSSLWY